MTKIPPNMTKIPPRWNNPIIVFHTLMVITMLILYISGDEYEIVHEVAGFCMLFLLLWRIYYSFITNKKSEKISSWFKQARFLKVFLKTFASHKETQFHNPAASLMIIGFFVVLFLMVFTGEFGLVGDEGEGLFSLFIEVDYTLGEWLLDVHEIGGNLLLFMIVFHILGAISSSIISKQNLIKSIFVRKKTK